MAEARLVRAGSRMRTIPFMGEGDALRYRRERYRLGPQRLLHLRELSIVRAALGMVPRPEGRRIAALDVPCGYGRLLAELGAAGFRAAGADLSPAQAAQARETSPAIAGNLLAGLPFRDGAFDLVLCVRLLHHLRDAADRAAAISELARVSRGHVLLSYYAREPLWSIHRRAMEHLRLRKPRIAVVGDDELLRDLATAGLERIASWRVAPVLHAHRYWLCRKVAGGDRTADGAPQTPR